MLAIYVRLCVCFHCLTRWWRTLHHFHTDVIVGQLLGSLSFLCKLACGRCELSLGHVCVEVEAPFVGFPAGPGLGIVRRYGVDNACVGLVSFVLHLRVCVHSIDFVACTTAAGLKLDAQSLCTFLESGFRKGEL